MDFISTPAEQASTAGRHDFPGEQPCSHGTPPRGAPICFDSLLDRCMRDPGFALVLLTELENSAPELMDLLAAQVEAGDAAAAAESLHKLKGATGIVAANHLCELARAGEVAGRDGDQQRLKSLLPEIRKGWDECREFLPTLRDRLS